MLKMVSLSIIGHVLSKEDCQTISNFITENNNAKNNIAAKDKKIEELNAEVSRLRAEIKKLSQQKIYGKQNLLVITSPHGCSAISLNGNTIQANRLTEAKNGTVFHF